MKHMRFLALALSIFAPISAVSAQHDLPIATHWDNSLPGVVEGASDQCPWSNPKSYVPSNYKTWLFYNGGFLPDYELYGGDVFSIRRVEDQEALDFADTIFSVTGVEVVHLNQRAWAQGGVKPNSGKVQIIHNNQIDGSLATIFLPPNWKPSNPGTYPILFNGYYDTNDNTFDNLGYFMAETTAVSTKNGGRGAIGVLWNGGGALVTRTGNRRAFDQFNSVIQAVAAKGGSPYEIVIFGTSRGGGTALAMASNPYHADEYRVVAVCASCFPAKYGENVILTSTTYPGLLSAVEWTVGLRTAWHTGWVYPSIPHPLAGLTANEAHLQILTGEKNHEVVDQLYSPISEGFLDALEDQAPAIYLQAGSHDYKAPYPLQMKYIHELEKRGIPAKVDVVIGIGHNTRMAAYGLPATCFWALNAIGSLVQGSMPSFPAGMDFYRIDRTTGNPVEFSPPRFPFTVEFPFRVAYGQRVPIIAVGEPGMEYRLDLCDYSTGLSVFQIRGAIDADRTRTHWLNTPTLYNPGTYIARAEIRDGPGLPWNAIPPENTPFILAEPLIEVQASEPYYDGIRARLWATNPDLLKTIDGVVWGLCEH